MAQEKLFSQGLWHEAMKEAGGSQFDVDAQRAIDGQLGKYIPKGGPSRLRVVRVSEPEISENNPEADKSIAV